GGDDHQAGDRSGRRPGRAARPGGEGWERPAGHHSAPAEAVRGADPATQERSGSCASEGRQGGARRQVVTVFGLGIVQRKVSKMITLEANSLIFRFPEVHDNAKSAIQFQRTLRIPDNGKHYPLPPGLGAFPLRHVEDFADRVPEQWHERAGVMMPLYQAEAMWIAFRDGGWWWSGRYPFAIKIAAGKINAISGKPWKPELDGSERDYIVLPEQPWLDGFCVAKDVIRQFVAMPLGSGYSVEEQITGKPEHGGLQIIAYPMRKK